MHQFRVPKSYNIYIRDQQVDVTKYPPKFPDINSVKKLWVILIKDFYVSGKRHKTEPELVAANKAP